jgi:hypothetical protein
MGGPYERVVGLFRSMPATGGGIDGMGYLVKFRSEIMLSTRPTML